ncbi:hypothetical protein [Comamonas sp.]|uniref:hypothetical protein n=1 Tax=Comamonas sp. TaxID=34028 RepID=UPI003A93E5E9
MTQAFRYATLMPKTLSPKIPLSAAQLLAWRRQICLSFVALNGLSDKQESCSLIFVVVSAWIVAISNALTVKVLDRKAQAAIKTEEAKTAA